MTPFFQKHWQSIRFDSITATSSRALAGPAFYDAFYRELFKRYRSYDDLDAQWRLDKADTARWLAERIPDGARVLSIGAGLGYVERCMQAEHGARMELHVQDFATEALRWLRDVLPPDRFHAPGTGPVQEGLLKFDVAYLCAVEYALDDGSLESLLREVRGMLREGGKCVLISVSLEQARSQLGAASRASKELVKSVLEHLGLYDRGQLWGWQRQRSEFHALLLGAGFTSLEDGFIQTPTQKTYFIEGRD